MTDHTPQFQRVVVRGQPETKSVVMRGQPVIIHPTGIEYVESGKGEVTPHFPPDWTKEACEAWLKANLVKACTECGCHIEYHCYHDGYSRPSVWMLPERSKIRRLSEYNSLLSQAEELLRDGDCPDRVIIDRDEYNDLLDRPVMPKPYGR